jgi:multiple sugar transport system substrate-binding protein
MDTTTSRPKENNTMADVRVSRRQILKAAAATGIATTSPWWLVNKSHAQRAKKLIFWQLPNFTPIADSLQKEQVYEFAKSAGLKDEEVEFSVVGNDVWIQKLSAAIEAGNPPDVMRLFESNVQFFGSQGHLVDMTDTVERMRKEPKGIFEATLTAVRVNGRFMGVPLAVNPWPMHARLDLLEKAKVDYPKTWDEFIETSKKIQEPPRLFAFGICVGITYDTTNNVTNLLWCYGGRTVEADNKTVVLNSPENAAGLKVLEAMFKTHKIIPPGSISWDDSGNNKAYQSKQAAFVMNPTSIYAYLDGNDKDLQKVTGLYPVPAGPKGSVTQIDTWSLALFKKSPYPELGKGLIEYMLRPDNYDRIVQSTGGRWVPVYKRLFDSPFWKEKPVFTHFIQMAEQGVPLSYAGSPTPAAGEVLNTHVIPKVVQRVLVENWPAEKALEEGHKAVAEIYARHNKG